MKYVYPSLLLSAAKSIPLVLAIHESLQKSEDKDLDPDQYQHGACSYPCNIMYHPFQHLISPLKLTFTRAGRCLRLRLSSDLNQDLDYLFCEYLKIMI